MKAVRAVSNKLARDWRAPDVAADNVLGLSERELDVWFVPANAAVGPEPVDLEGALLRAGRAHQLPLYSREGPEVTAVGNKYDHLAQFVLVPEPHPSTLASWGIRSADQVDDDEADPLRKLGAELIEVERAWWFVNEHGLVHLCRHLRSRGHCDSSLDQAVPATAVISYARLLRAPLQLAEVKRLTSQAAPAYLELGPPTHELGELASMVARVDPSASGVFQSSDHDRHFPGEAGSFAAVQTLLSGVLEDSSARPAFSWSPLAHAHLGLESNSSLLTGLIHELASELEHPSRFRACRGCWRIIDLASRKRRPDPKLMVWCDVCRPLDVHKRFWERRNRLVHFGPGGGD